jgi:ACS family allantoate permease-like MFS transporter
MGFRGRCLATSLHPSIVCHSTQSYLKQRGRILKKITTTFLAFVMFCVGNIVSPQLFIATEAPGCKTSCAAMLVAIVLCLLLTKALGLYYVLENKRRDRVLAAISAEVLAAPSVKDEEFLDRTVM